MATSPAAPELPGINDLASRSLDVADLRDSWLGTLAKQFRFQWRPGEATPDELAVASKLVSEKYANDAWTRRR
jgi:lipoate-protein ligase A